MQVTPSISGYGQPSFTVLPLTKTRAFTATSYCEPTYRFLWHYHPEWEVVFTRSGRGTRHVGTSVEKFTAGDLAMLPGNVPHTWFSSKDQVEETRCTVIHFLPQVWGESFWKLPEIKDFHTLCQSAQRGVRFSGEGCEEVGQRMEALAANGAPSLESFTELWKIFTLLTKLDVHSLHAVEEGKTDWQNARLDELLAWLESRLGEPFTQQEAAARVKMSPAAFSRWFKVNMGCVFNRYLNEIRVARVCSEIAHGKLSITEAAFQAGYNNLSNFNRRFLEVTGLTPKAFRLQIQQPDSRKARSA
jgi:AraC-like DNA-binding protein/quercetin dioxygenase-like cupin family protein